MIDPRNPDDRLEIGSLGMFALMEIMDEGDSDVFDKWLRKPGPGKAQGDALPPERRGSYPPSFRDRASAERSE